ncbi:MAG: hypothetical protein JWQ08_1614 [Deinococcus sp.]|nr:hypothetical protein [Deinococcus sp.]
MSGEQHQKASLHIRNLENVAQLVSVIRGAFDDARGVILGDFVVFDGEDSGFGRAA